VNAERIERVVIAEHVLDFGDEEETHKADQDADDDCRKRAYKSRAAGVMATSPATRPVITPSMVGTPL
jgi:hypothetical protein